MKLKRTVVLVLCVGVLIWLVVFLYFNCKYLFYSYKPPIKNDTIPSEVFDVAKEGLDKFVRNNKSDLTRNGFVNQQEKDNAKLGDPILPYNFEKWKMLIANPNDKNSLSSILYPAAQIAFPIYVGNDLRNVLYVDYFNGQWRASEMGQLHEINFLIECEATYPSSKGYKIYWYNDYSHEYGSFVLITHPQENPKIFNFDKNNSEAEYPTFIKMWQSFLRKKIIENSLSNPFLIYYN